MAERPRLRFFLDNCVPDSVGHALLAAGHEVIFQREALAVDAADTLVAIASAENEAILISQDKDFATIASRLRISHRSLRKLSRISLKCSEVQAAARITAGLSLIEAEWAIAKASPNGRMFIEIYKAGFKTIR